MPSETLTSCWTPSGVDLGLFDEIADDHAARVRKQATLVVEVESLVERNMQRRALPVVVELALDLLAVVELHEEGQRNRSDPRIQQARERAEHLGASRGLLHQLDCRAVAEGALQQDFLFGRQRLAADHLQRRVDRGLLPNADDLFEQFAFLAARRDRDNLPLMMVAEKHVPLYLSPYIESKKGTYYASLKDAQQRLDWQPIITFMADAVTGTVDELIRTRAALSELSDVWRERPKFRKGSAAARALDELHNYPVATAKRLGALLDISPPQVHQAIAQLEEAGILEERTGYSRNRVYAATEALGIINRPVGEEPLLPDQVNLDEE
jgi:DNA-binding transcriptional ArsR family regulator